MPTRDDKEGRAKRLAPIAREVNPERAPVADITRYSRSIAGEPFGTGDPVKQYREGRICAAPDCTTKLSRYNPSPTCSQHPSTKLLLRTPKVVRIDSKKIRNLKAKKPRNKGKK